MEVLAPAFLTAKGYFISTKWKSYVNGQAPKNVMVAFVEMTFNPQKSSLL